MSEKDDYFNYVSSVLGVKSAYIEADTAGTDLQATEAVPLMVLVENLSQYTAEEKDLLEKMITALKIDINKIKIFDLQNLQPTQQTQFEFLLTFSENPAQTTSNDENFLITYSPRILVQNAALKKQVWNDLQKVIKFFLN